MRGNIFTDKLLYFRSIMFLSAPFEYDWYSLVIVFKPILFKKFFPLSDNQIIKDILKKNKNCKIVDGVNQKYEYGLSVYCTSKIKLQDFKIYNFHLGNLQSQRGSFIFFYKFIKDWNSVTLTFHEITEKFDVGKIVNEKKISLEENCKATDIFFIYIKNFDFLIESLNLIESRRKKEYLEYEKINVVPTFINLIKLTFLNFFKK